MSETTIVRIAGAERPDPTPVIGDVLTLIDQNLGLMHARDLVTTAEVTDVLLDMRGLLAAIQADNKQVT